MNIQVIRNKISREKLQGMAGQYFENLVKAVVDVEQGVMAIGGELHADEEALLLEQGSKQQDLWGINIFPKKEQKEWIEFDSMINLRPSYNNRSRGVDDPSVRQKIIKIVNNLIG